MNACGSRRGGCVGAVASDRSIQKKSRRWKVYWQRADLKWHSCAPRPEVHTLVEFFALLEDE